MLLKVGSQQTAGTPTPPSRKRKPKDVLEINTIRGTIRTRIPGTTPKDMDRQGGGRRGRGGRDRRDRRNLDPF